MKHELYIQETFYDVLRMRYVTLTRSIVTSSLQSVKNGISKLKANAEIQRRRTDRRDYRLTIKLYPYNGAKYIHAVGVMED